jgi:hypothetical protein
MSYTHFLSNIMMHICFSLSLSLSYLVSILVVMPMCVGLKTCVAFTIFLNSWTGQLKSTDPYEPKIKREKVF